MDLVLQLDEIIDVNLLTRILNTSRSHSLKYSGTLI